MKLENRKDIFDRALPASVGLALITAVLAVAANNMIVDLDLFHEMALFRQFLSEGVMPQTDDFAYTPTIEQVVHHEWATGAVLYWVTVSTGWGAAGLVGLKYLLTFSVCFACYLYGRQEGVTLPTFASLAPLALNIGGWMAFTNVRAQLFTLFFLLILFFLLKVDLNGKRWWVLIWLPLSVVWSNMHGGVVSGIGLLGVYIFSRCLETCLSSGAVKEVFRRQGYLLLVGVATTLLLMVNPYGWDYVPYLVRAVRMDRPLITEWQPLWQGGSPHAMLLYLISVGIAVYAVAHTRRRAIFETLALGLTAYLALKNLRHGSLYAVTWICLVPPMVQTTDWGTFVERIWNARAPQLTAVAIAISLVAVGFSIHAKFWSLRVPSAAVGQLPGAPVYPVGAVNYLADSGFRGNLFVPFATGAFISWKLYPQVRVSIDSRYEVAYPPGAVEESVAFYRAQNDWRAVLEKYNTDAVLVPSYNSILKELQRAAKEDPDFPWKRVYTDDSYSVFVRSAVQEKLTFVDRRGHRVIPVFP
jgi:hypothetical protein